MEDKFGSMGYVVVERNKLLEILKTNKDKHDTILNASCSGYWELAKTKLEEKRREFQESIVDINEAFDFTFKKAEKKIDEKDHASLHLEINARLNFNPDLRLQYPTDHSEDYDKIIRMVELSIYDKFQLTSSEFDAYVLNRWDWKKDFVTTSAFYLNNVNITGAFRPLASGCLVNF